jgi:recombination protein RecT
MQKPVQAQQKPLQPQKVFEFEKNISDSVQNRITELAQDRRLVLPPNYSVGNALASAWLILQNVKDRNGQPALKVCTPQSIANALLDMAIMGHNPAKKHGYFIVYGDQLTWFPSYFGKCASLKRIDGIEHEPVATLIYDGDEIVLEHNELGEEIIIEHKTSWQNKLKGDIVGAYATVDFKGVKRSAVMSMKEIKEAWTKNPSPANRRDHTEFTGEFAKRTVINRLVKMILQTSNDDDLLAETIVQNEDQHWDFTDAQIVSEENKAKREIATNANAGKIIDVTPEPTSASEPKSSPEVKPQPEPTPEPAPAPKTEQQTLIPKSPWE